MANGTRPPCSKPNLSASGPDAPINLSFKLDIGLSALNASIKPDTPEPGFILCAACIAS